MGGRLIRLGLLVASGVAAATGQVPGTCGDAELLRALREAPSEELGALLTRAHRRLVEHAERGDPAAALPLAEALFERAPAPWSADSLSLTLSRLGQHGRARAVLEPVLARTPAGPQRSALLQRRALAARGGGQERRARADLGAGLAAGSADAASLLGLLELGAGRPERARALFRGVLWGVPPDDPRQAWARRGWGLTMLPPGPESEAAPPLAPTGAPKPPRPPPGASRTP